MFNITLISTIVALASLAATVFIMKCFAHLIRANITNVSACFACVLCTSLVMAGAVKLTPVSGIQPEYLQFLISVTLSSVVYHIFLNATIIRSIFLAATNFIVQIFTLLGFSVAVNMAQAQHIMS